MIESNQVSLHHSQGLCTIVACGTNSLYNFSAGIFGMAWVLSAFLPDDTVSSFVGAVDGLVCLELGFTSSTLHISARLSNLHAHKLYSRAVAAKK